MHKNKTLLKNKRLKIACHLIIVKLLKIIGSKNNSQLIKRKIIVVVNITFINFLITKHKVLINLFNRNTLKVFKL